MRRHGQSAVEYLTIVAISLIIIIPSAFFIVDFSRDIQGQSEAKQLDIVGNKLLSTIEQIYASKAGSFVTLDVEVPDTFRNATVQDDSEIVFVYQSPYGQSDLVFFSDNVNVTSTSCGSPCQLPIEAGYNRIRVKNEGFLVNITQI